MLEKIFIAATGLLLGDYVMLQVVLLLGIFFVSSSVYQEKNPYLRGKDNRLHAILRWCCIGVLFAGALFAATAPKKAAKTIEVVVLMIIAAAIAVILVAVVWNLFQIPRAVQVQVDKSVTECFDLFSPPGAALVTRFLRKAWNRVAGDVQEHVLVSIKAMFALTVSSEKERLMEETIVPRFIPDACLRRSDRDLYGRCVPR